MAIDSSGEWWTGSEPADIRDFLAAYTRLDGAYPSSMYRSIRCPCGSDRFRLERARSIVRRTCPACRASSFTCRDSDHWDEAVAGDVAEPYACVECSSPEANIMIGFALYDEAPEIDAVKWFYVGIRCAGCGVLGCFGDGKVGRGPAADVYDSA
jgi:hypothetical protein